MSKDFLFEIGCEELPSFSVSTLAAALKEQCEIQLEKKGLHYNAIKTFATPRRLALLITALDDKQPTQTIIKRGPALSAAYTADKQPTPALRGFISACNTTLDNLRIHQTEKGDWIVFEQVVEGGAIETLLPAMINDVITKLPIGKPMRWADNDFSFVRPVHWIVSLLDDKILDFSILGVQAGRETYGHRFHANKPIHIPYPKAYEALLEKAYVIADEQKRRKAILSQIETLAHSEEAEAITPPDLIDEVNAIVEWPHALLAHFNESFLTIPQEVLITSMQTHQKCFALQTKDKKLLPAFIALTNIISEKPEQVIHGNEKVITARLRDAEFFFQQDKKIPLASLVPLTQKVIFQAKLGSLYDKSQRIKALMLKIAPSFQLNPVEAERAAELSKCDLLTGMVNEFPELEGLMGYYYGLNDKENVSVCTALLEQYLPRFATDALPETALGIALSLTDRIDTVVGIFSIGQKPTGEKDPFKLRRHALAIIRLLMTAPCSLSLSQMIEDSLSSYLIAADKLTLIKKEVYDFIMERLYNYYAVQSIEACYIDAVKPLASDDLQEMNERIKAIHAFSETQEASVLIAGCKRINHLLNKNASSTKSAPVIINPALLIEDIEQTIYANIARLQTDIPPLKQAANFTAILNKLIPLAATLNTFFDEVMVMTDDKALQTNRLALLEAVKNLLESVADISFLPHGQ